MTRPTHSSIACLAAILVSVCAFAQTPTKGWEASLGVLYQDAEDIGFNGGSQLRSDSDFGVIGAIGYSFNPKLDLIFGFDSATVGYDLTRQSASTPGVTQRLRGDYEVFTPYLKLNYNFLPSNLTPFVSGGVGWSFIDTNIPTGNVFIGCWWDPWYGYLCTPYDETKTTDAFAYHLGVGARWTFNDTYGLRLEYEKQWLDLERANGTPSFDQIRLTFVIKYW